MQCFLQISQMITDDVIQKGEKLLKQLCKVFELKFSSAKKYFKCSKVYISSLVTFLMTL